MGYGFSKSLFKGEYGSIIVFTRHIDISKYKRSPFDSRSAIPFSETIWGIRGVREYDKVCNAINNASAPLITDRERVEGYIPTQKEKAAEDMLKKKLHKRQEKMRRRQEKINRKNGY